MDAQLVSTVVLGVPNFAIALWCLWRQQRTIDALLANQEALIQQLVKLCATEK